MRSTASTRRPLQTSPGHADATRLYLGYGITGVGNWAGCFDSN